MVGEPGIGKSRLVEELLAGRRATVPAPSASRVRASTSRRRRTSRSAGCSARCSAGRDAAAEARGARGWPTGSRLNAPQLVAWLPLLGIPLDLDLPRHPGDPELDEQFRKGRLEDVVDELLAAVLPTPTVLVVEDAHLMDDASADLVDRLTRRHDRPAVAGAGDPAGAPGRLRAARRASTW